MRDPQEGVTPQGTIRTGASRDAVAPIWEPVLAAAVDALPGGASLYVYGSVATGTAEVPRSDVDLLSIGLPAEEAARSSADLSARFRELCREVSIAPASWADLEGDGDASYGFRVFLRHYCVRLAGDDPSAGLPGYPADARAARGFNGDIARHAAGWLDELDGEADVARLATRISRKTLLAVAGLVSVRDGTWSTDRRNCAARWNELEPDLPVDTLMTWLDSPATERAEVIQVLHGPVAAIVQAFDDELGLWDG